MMPLLYRWCVICGCTLLAGCLSPQHSEKLAQLEERIKQMPSPAQPFYGDIVYKSTLFQDVKLDLYLPYEAPKAGGKSPVYIFVHGGSWMFGNQKQIRMAGQLVDRLRSEGVAVVSIDYRKLPKAGFSSIIEDGIDSLHWLSAHADQYQLDLGKTVLHGASAGGHIALMMGFTEQLPDLEVQLIIDEYGPTDLVALSEHRLPGRRNFLSVFPDFRLQAVSPVSYLDGDKPPVYIIHGEFDELVPLSQSELLFAALREQGQKADMYVVKAANHGLLDASKEERQRLTHRRIDLILGAIY